MMRTTVLAGDHWMVQARKQVIRFGVTTPDEECLTIGTFGRAQGAWCSNSRRARGGEWRTASVRRPPFTTHTPTAHTIACPLGRAVVRSGPPTAEHSHCPTLRRIPIPTRPCLREPSRMVKQARARYFASVGEPNSEPAAISFTVNTSSRASAPVSDPVFPSSPVPRPRCRRGPHKVTKSPSHPGNSWMFTTVRRHGLAPSKPTSQLPRWHRIDPGASVRVPGVITVGVAVPHIMPIQATLRAGFRIHDPEVRHNSQRERRIGEPSPSRFLIPQPAAPRNVSNGPWSSA